MPDRQAHSFSAVERLRRRGDFQAAARGTRAAGPSFVLQARRRDETGAARIGFTVSRQVGNAVERNRVRRRLREMVRLSSAGRLCAGHDYVLVGRRQALAAPFEAMVREFATALSRVHAAGRGTGTGGGSPSPPHQAGLTRPRRAGSPPAQSSRS